MIAAIALVFSVGIFLGLSGIGGFLIPPVLVATFGLDSRTAVALTLLSFVPSGLIGAYLQSRHRTLSWGLAGLLSLGTIPGLWIGRIVSTSVSEVTLQRILGFVLVVVAVVLVVQRRRLVAMALDGRTHVRSHDTGVSRALAIAAGCVGGIAAVVAGVGGPVVVVPALSSIGLDADRVIGAALLNSVLVSTLGAALLAPTVTVDVTILETITIAQVVGLVVGVWLRSRIGVGQIANVIVGLSLVAAAYLLMNP